MLTLFVIITFLVSALVGVVVIPRIIIISKKKKLFDEISERKLHHGNIPRLGGVAFLPAFIFSVALIMGVRYIGGWEIRAGSLETDVFQEGMFLLAGLTMVFFTGLADDLTGLTYKSKFVVQILVSLLLVYGGCGIGNLGGLFGIHAVPTFVGTILTVLVCVLLMNAYNLIDGIDGLCSGLSLLTLGALGIWFTWNNLYVYGIMIAGIVGVVSVFFFYNVSSKRLKIFMGDTGSLTLGYLMAFFGLKFYNMNVETAMFNTPAAPAVFLGMVFIPVFDTIRVFFVRIKAGLSPFYPDKRHIHHKMLQLGLNHFQSSMTIIFLQACFVVLNVLLKDININILFFLDLILGLLMISVIDFLGKQNRKFL